MIDPPPRPAAPKRRHLGRVAIVVLLLVASGVAVWWWWRPSGQASANERSPASQPARATPVVVATVHRGKLPVYIDGLGTVTALNTVTLRSRVDGQLVKVNFTEGQMVKQGDLLVQIDPKPYQVQLEQAQGQLARDQALLENAKLDLARYQDAREAVSQQQLDTAKSLVAQYAGALLTDQAAIDSAKLQLSYATITAPISGKIGLRLVDEGNMIHASDTTGLAVITQLQPIAVQFSLPEGDLQRILKAMDGKQTLQVEAFDRDMKTRLAVGELSAVDSQIDPATATARFKAKFDNADGVLYPNGFVNVRLLVQTIENAVIVPSAALQRSPQGVYVYVVKPDQTVENRTVTPGEVEGDQTQILQGLDGDETLVIDGVDKLRPGASITTRPTDGGGGGGGGGGAQHKRGNK